MKILVIGAHPDDYELGMAGTILSHVDKGDTVYAILATDGGVLEDGKKRLDEAKEVANFMGIKEVFYLGLKDTEITDGKSTIDLIEKIIDKINPDRIYTHGRTDTHQDHRNLSNASLSAARRVKQVLFFESPSTQTDFGPNFFVDITDYMDKKLEALKLYESVGQLRYFEKDSVIAGAKFRGFQCNRKQAESFHIFRFLE